MVMTKFVGIPKHTNVAPHEYKRIRYQNSPFGFRSISVSGRRGVGHRTIRSRLNATCLYRQALQHGLELGIDLVSPLAKRALSLLTEDVGYNRP